MQPVFLLPALCDLYIVFYGLRGGRHLDPMGLVGMR